MNPAITPSNTSPRRKVGDLVSPDSVEKELFTCASSFLENDKDPSPSPVPARQFPLNYTLPLHSEIQSKHEPTYPLLERISSSLSDEKLVAVQQSSPPHFKRARSNPAHSQENYAFGETDSYWSLESDNDSFTDESAFLIMNEIVPYSISVMDQTTMHEQHDPFHKLYEPFNLGRTEHATIDWTASVQSLTQRIEAETDRLRDRLLDLRFPEDPLPTTPQNYSWHGNYPIQEYRRRHVFPKLPKHCYWKIAVDASSGDTYYYHRKTHETTWDRPAGLVEWEEAQRAQERRESIRESVLLRYWTSATVLFDINESSFSDRNDEG